jgi:hypothetical protein
MDVADPVVGFSLGQLIIEKKPFRFSRMSPTRFLIAARWPLVLVPISAPTP